MVWKFNLEATEKVSQQWVLFTHWQTFNIKKLYSLIRIYQLIADSSLIFWLAEKQIP